MKTWEAIAGLAEDERGLETVEYAVILGLIILGALVFMQAVGEWVKEQFEIMASQP